MSELAPIRVVLVDDEEDVRFVLGLQLEAEDDISVVGTAVDGAEALTRCAELRPDVVVLDLLMPNVTGFEAIGRLQAEQPDVGIVAYTGVAGDFVRTEMERLRVTLVLKTGDSDVLLRAIRAVAGREAGARSID